MCYLKKRIYSQIIVCQQLADLKKKKKPKCKVIASDKNKSTNQSPHNNELTDCVNINSTIKCF